MRKRCKLLLVSLLSFGLSLSMAVAQKFSVTLNDNASKPFSGNIILYLSKTSREPISGNVGIEKFPCFRLYATNIKSGAAVLFDDNAISYPAKLSDLERGDYYVQAVWDKNEGGRAIAESPGNIYSKPMQVHFTKNFNQTFTIVCDQVIEAPKFVETTNVKELAVASPSLTAFYGRPATVNAAVVLPKEYAQDPGRKFPVLFYVFGFGADYHRLSGDTTASMPMDTVPCIRIILDGNCPLGHSVYANSDNNGPWGDALTKEFIPALENKFRCDGARFLHGHSSGGWTVLWLQTQYPKVFAGCWSSSPDPVDFRSFLKVNLYEEKNMFYGKDSALNAEATIAGRFPVYYMRDAYQTERVVYRGEQMNSLNAVFSKKGKDGNPEPVCDPVTGVIDQTVFAHWKKYDISLNLRSNWAALKPDLDGKIRVTVGKNDNFLLNYAVMLLDEEMKKINANVNIEYFPGDHFTVYTPDYRTKGYQFLAQKYREWKAKH